jgi:hypothetical protein
VTANRLPDRANHSGTKPFANYDEFAGLERRLSVLTWQVAALVEVQVLVGVPAVWMLMRVAVKGGHRLSHRTTRATGCDLSILERCRAVHPRPRGCEAAAGRSTGSPAGQVHRSTRARVMLGAIMPALKSTLAQLSWIEISRIAIVTSLLSSR